MLTIACLSQKGGVGKSTIARLVARTYAAAGWQVKIADFNTKQKTAVDWNALRLSLGIDPSLQAEAFASPKVALRQQDWDLMVMDGKPDSDAGTLELAHSAHLILIPTAPNQDDLSPQIRFAHELKKQGIRPDKMMFIINKTTDSPHWSQEARRYVSDAGYHVAKTDLPVKQGYQSAQNTGRAISETNFQSLNDRAEALAEEVAQKAKQLAGL